jgi:quercetin dioxygenase-like cupin family protein
MFPRVVLILGCLAAAAGQPHSQPILTNLDTARWTHDKGDPEGVEGVTVHTDETTGGMDLLVRCPPGHVIAPHWHDSNERIFMAEGQLTLRQDSGDSLLKAGGFAFLPARQAQRLSCTSATACTFYLSWDGKPNSHPAQ